MWQLPCGAGFVQRGVCVVGGDEGECTAEQRCCFGADTGDAAPGFFAILEDASPRAPRGTCGRVGPQIGRWFGEVCGAESAEDGGACRQPCRMLCAGALVVVAEVDTGAVGQKIVKADNLQS